MCAHFLFLSFSYCIPRFRNKPNPAYATMSTPFIFMHLRAPDARLPQSLALLWIVHKYFLPHKKAYCVAA